VQPGSAIAYVGRTGRNASQKRSPTHLHLMTLAIDNLAHLKPINIYDQLH